MQPVSKDTLLRADWLSHSAIYRRKNNGWIYKFFCFNQNY